MGRMSKKDMEELREFLDLGCDYAGTEEVVMDTADAALKELGSELGYECLYITDGDDIGIELEDFIKAFYGKTVENILNVVETQGK